MDDEDQAYEDAAADEEAQRAKLTRAPHRLTVTVTRRWGVETRLTCEGDATSECHWWRDEEGDPRTYREQGECSVLPWYLEDQQAFLESYDGPDRDGLTSGLIDVHGWGEGGIDWSYAEQVR